MNAELDGEGRAIRAEEALEEALAERNQLWQELQRRASAEEDLAYWRTRAENMERSRWWRMGKPFRLAKRALRDPQTALEVLARRVGSERDR